MINNINVLNNIKNEKFYSPEDLATKLQVSLSSIYKLIKNEGLPHIRLGKVYRIPASDLKKFLAARGKDISWQEDPKIPEVAHRLLHHLQASDLADSVVEVLLFGSYARGDYDMDSDVDLLIVLEKRTVEMTAKLTELSEMAMEEVDYEELLSIKEVSKQEWMEMKKNKYLLAQIVEQEGVQLWKNH